MLGRKLLLGSKLGLFHTSLMIVQESWLSIWNTMLMLCENGCLYISVLVHSYYIGWNYDTLKASMIRLLNLWQRLCFNVVILIQQNVTKFFILKNRNVFLTVLRAENPTSLCWQIEGKMTTHFLVHKSLSFRYYLTWWNKPLSFRPLL